MSHRTRYTFKKSERLTQKKIIQQLFLSKTKRIKAFPLSLHFIETSLSASTPCQILISVPQKKIRKAFKRNRIKRLIREAYRLQKHELYQQLGTQKQIAVAIVYLHTDVLPFATIQQSVNQLLHDLVSRIS